VQPAQDNRSNVVKKLEKRKITSKISFQTSKKQVQNENDEKVEYARSVFLNANSIPKEVELNRCLIAKTNMGWLWHRRLAHVGMRNLHKLQKKWLHSLTNKYYF
jgi:hypothetical protein